MSRPEYWEKIRNLTRNDHEAVVPDVAVEAALKIYAKRAHGDCVFRELSRQSKTTRSAGNVTVHHFELSSGHYIDIEVEQSDRGYHIQGYSNTLLSAQVFLYLDEKESMTWLDFGRFEFSDLEAGNYRVMFRDEAVSYWIQQLQVGVGH